MTETITRPSQGALNQTGAIVNKDAYAEAQDFLPLKGIDYVEFWVGNARQASNYYRALWGFTPTAFSGLETKVRDLAWRGVVPRVCGSVRRRRHVPSQRRPHVRRGDPLVHRPQRLRRRFRARVPQGQEAGRRSRRIVTARDRPLRRQRRPRRHEQVRRLLPRRLWLLSAD